MGATIHTIPLGIDNVYVVKDKGAVIIDSGAPKKGKAFKKALENIGIKPEEIQLIICIGIILARQQKSRKLQAQRL